MLGKRRRILHSQRGFTLVELMTVLIILGVVLAIGVPKYLQIQAKAEWEADADTITNFARTAEVYATSNNKFHISIGLKEDLIDNKLIEDAALNRKRSTNNVSVKNNGIKVSTYTEARFGINEKSGNVNNLGQVIQLLIGNPPYGTGPEFPSDKVKVTWTETNIPSMPLPDGNW